LERPIGGRLETIGPSIGPKTFRALRVPNRGCEQDLSGPRFHRTSPWWLSTFPGSGHRSLPRPIFAGTRPRRR